MKILVFDITVLGAGHGGSNTSGGVYRAVEHLAKELAQSEDFEIQFSSVSGINTLAYSSDYLVRNSTSFKGIPLIDCSGGLLKRVRRTFQKISSIQSKVVNQPAKCIYNLNRLSLLLNLSGVSRKSISNIDLFHSPYFPIPDPIRKNPAIKKFITIYDLVPLIYPDTFKWSLKHGFWNILRSLDHDINILCISETTKNDLCHYRPDIDPARITVTSLAASDDFYQASQEEIRNIRKKYQLPEGKYFLSLCTLEPRKNLGHVIRCFIKLLQEKQVENDLYLVLAGPKGWLYSEIFDEISTSRFLERIIVTGYVEEEDLAPLYSGAMGFIYPSLYEGFGLPPLEAMQCGTPVIASNTSSLPEVVGEAGILVNPRDADSLCQEMVNLYRSSELRENLSKKGIERAKEFTWQKCAAKTFKAYQSVK